jgi:AcrR family transcriptional regulator
MPTTRAARTARRRVPLDREQVLRTALEIADEGGVEALTMASVGQKLGVEAMSLYRHVRNKQEILDGIVDIVFGEIELAPTRTNWKAAMRRRAISARTVLTRHPWAIGLMESLARPGPANLRHHDAVLGVLHGAGFSSAKATRAYNLLNSYIYGFLLQEMSLPFRTREQVADLGKTMLPQLPENEYPHLSRVAVDLAKSGFVYANEFEAGLDLILDTIETRIRAKAR